MEIKVFRGLRNVTSDERFVEGDLALADNLDLDNTGALRSRVKTSLLQAGAYHSLWADGDVCLVVNSSNDLLRVNPDWSLTTLTRLSSGRRVSYARLANQVYLSNGVDSLRIVNGEPLLWGTPRPSAQPAAEAAAGTLPPGSYQYAMTYRRADGQESGTGPAKSIELASSGGIRFTGLESSTDPEVRDKLIYLSGPNGTELFRVLVVPAGETTAVFRGPIEEATIRLETQFASPAPAGDIVEIWNGSTFVANGNLVHYSDPYALERFRLGTQFLQFPGVVTMFAAVNDGIYVSTLEKTWFLTGNDPSALKSRELFDYGALPGTATKTVYEDIKAEEGGYSGKAVFWASPQGACLGLDGGMASNLTEKHFAYTSGQRGSGIVRRARGYTQYLAALEGTGVAGNSYS